jgi:rsbT co-antagonist protein RsbR
MRNGSKSIIPDILKNEQHDLLEDWMEQQLAVGPLRSGSIQETELRGQARAFLHALSEALEHGDPGDVMASAWSPVRDMLADISATRAKQGFSPSETATFIFSLKQPLFARLRQKFGRDAAGLAEDTWAATTLMDKLGLWTTDVYQKSRDAIITRQQQELLELSTPVVKLWDGVVALPLIGTLDSARTQVVMENLLNSIVETSSAIAIIDITGVPLVDTLVAQHLLRTVAAARLMGAECIISGIRPQIAQTIVHLGIELTDVTTKATLADALALALQRTGYRVMKRSDE